MVLLLSNQHSRWLIFNGISASNFSNQILLTEGTLEAPEWAWNYVIKADSKEQAVLFSRHHSMHTYAYSPKQAPSSSYYNWQHLIGSWYVGKIKT